jgi:DNA-binding IclR family transcriptional regulator
MPADAVPALVRAHAILDLVAGSATPPGITAIARALALPKSTVHSLCTTLTALGLLERQPGGTFRIGGHVMVWAHAFAGNADMVGRFVRLWEERSELHAHTLTLSTLDGHAVTYIACRDGADPLGITFRIGMRLPAAFTATGKAMLSTMTDAAVRDLYVDGLPHPLTPHSVRDLDALCAELAAVRARGYSVDDGQVREDMVCFGAPVRDFSGTRAVGGIAISMRRSALDVEGRSEFGRIVIAEAERLSRELGAPDRD